MQYVEGFHGFDIYRTESGYLARNRERTLTAKTYIEIFELIYLWTCC